MLEKHLPNYDEFSTSQNPNQFYHDYKQQGNLISASFIPGKKIVSDLLMIKSENSKYVENLQTQKTHYFYLRDEF